MDPKHVPPEAQICCLSLETVGAIYSGVNASEREIKELKTGVSHKLLWSRAPKHLWDGSLELEAYIRSNSAHEI